MKKITDLIRKYLLESMNTDEALLLKRIPEKNLIAVQSDLEDTKKAGYETYKNKETLKKNKFVWNSELSAWVAPDQNFQDAQKTLNAINKKEVFIDKLEDLEELVLNSDAQNKVDISDRIKLFVDDLANATDEAAADAKIKQYLNFFGRFRNYSFTNTMLIFIQRPNATRVAGFSDWKNKFHRQVQEGAKGITIFRPVKYKTTDKDSGEEGERVSFAATNVFDIADTKPIDEKGEIPKVPEWFDDNTPNETADKLYKYVEEVVQGIGINLTQNDATGGEKGFSAGNHINLTSNIAGVGRVSTLIHELAHELMHHRKSSPFYDEVNIKNNLSRGMAELQAESVSYTVLRHYNIPVQHHATYLALWKANKEAIQSNLNIIIKVSKFIIEEIDKVAESNKNIQDQNNI